jgi:hypothetical protein
MNIGGYLHFTSSRCAARETAIDIVLARSYFTVNQYYDGALILIIIVYSRHLLFELRTDRDKLNFYLQNNTAFSILYWILRLSE